MKKLDFEQMVFVPLPRKWNIALDRQTLAYRQSLLQAFGNTSIKEKEAAKTRKAKPAIQSSRF
ncbi:hypothetical protein [Silvimonas amylolytica]|uniref:hypothetical protein n=1 Tax=Silvimonas amylolytica TaxID=449663 RepID=UPI0016696D10|nr:hypothetical protein [Silvimonas amylolytica]